MNVAERGLREEWKCQNLSVHSLNAIASFSSCSIEVVNLLSLLTQFFVPMNVR